MARQSRFSWCKWNIFAAGHDVSFRTRATICYLIRTVTHCMCLLSGGILLGSIRSSTQNVENLECVEVHSRRQVQLDRYFTQPRTMNSNYGRMNERTDEQTKFKRVLPMHSCTIVNWLEWYINSIDPDAIVHCVVLCVLCCVVCVCVVLCCVCVLCSCNDRKQKSSTKAEYSSSTKYAFILAT